MWDRDRVILKLQDELLQRTTAHEQSSHHHQQEMSALGQRLEAATAAAESQRALQQALGEKERQSLVEAESLTAQLGAAARDYATQEATSREKSAQISKLTELATDLENTNATLVRANRDATERAAALLKQLQVLSGEKTELQQTLEATEGRLRKELEAANTKFDAWSAASRQELHNTITQLQRSQTDEVAEVKKHLSETETKLHAALATAADWQQRYTALQATHESLAGRATALRDQTNSACERLAASGEALTQARRERDDAAATQVALEEKFRQSQSQLCQRSQEAEQLKIELLAAVQRSTAEGRARQEAQTKHEALTARVATLEAQLQVKATLEAELQAVRESAEADREAASQSRANLQALSLRTLELNDLKVAHQALRDEMLVLEARVSCSETRLVHTLQDGANATQMLEHGMRKFQHTAAKKQEDAASKRVLVEATQTLRQALEDEGYDLGTLPLAPTDTLELAYLQRVLLEHVAQCAQHFTKSQRSALLAGTTAAVPSASRTPLIYRR